MPQRGDRKGWGVGKWIGCGCGGCLLALLLVVAAIAAIGGLAFFGIKQADAYKQAVEHATRDPRVQAALGQPITAGFMVSGSINVNGSSGSADLSIPISGPDGAGTIYVRATKSAGSWEFSTLEVKVDATGDRIDLLGAPAERPLEEGPEEAPAGTPVSLRGGCRHEAPAVGRIARRLTGSRPGAVVPT